MWYLTIIFLVSVWKQSRFNKFWIFVARIRCVVDSSNWLWKVASVPDFLPVKSCQNIVIVVCPLTSIIEDQTSALKLIGIPADILPIIKENSSLYNADCLFERKEDSESEQTSVWNILYGTSVLKYFLTKAMHFLHSAYSDRETVRSLYNNSTRLTIRILF